MSWLTKGFKSIGEIFARKDRAPKDLSLRQGTAEYEYFAARAELDHGNLSHGMNHLAELLSFDPSYTEWLELLEAYLSRAGNNPESLLSKESQKYYAVEAIRAFIYARSGRLQDAIQLLGAVVEAKPDVPYMEAWGFGWLNRPGALESLPRDVAVRLLAGALSRFPEFRYLTKKNQQYLLQYTELAKRFHQSFTRDELSEMLHTGLLRKAGSFNEALAQAKATMESNPGWHAAIALGLVLREMGRSDEAEAALRHALDFDPDDITALLEIGDMYFNLEDWPRAQACYEEVLTRHPQHEWAYPSVLYCRWKMAPAGEPFPNELIKLLTGDKPNRRANEFTYQFRPYTGYLPEPVDATANVLSQLLDNDKVSSGTDSELKLTLSCLEAPSNMLTFKLAFGDGLRLVTKVEAIPKPDPRKAIEPVRFSLWRYNETQAEPALPPPGEEVSKSISAIAGKNLDISQLWAAASHLATEITPARVEEVLAVMVYPPMVPENFRVLDWLPRVQQVAAFVLAHLDSGWSGSVRRDALYSVLLGPRDWTTTAAIVALAQLAEEYKVISPDVGEAFQKLADAFPNIGYCCYEYALYYNWSRLPHLFDKERDELREKARKLEKTPSGE